MVKYCGQVGAPWTGLFLDIRSKRASKARKWYSVFSNHSGIRLYLDSTISDTNVELQSNVVIFHPILSILPLLCLLILRLMKCIGLTNREMSKWHSLFGSLYIFVECISHVYPMFWYLFFCIFICFLTLIWMASVALNIYQKHTKVWSHPYFVRSELKLLSKYEHFPFVLLWQFYAIVVVCVG